MVRCLTPLAPVLGLLGLVACGDDGPLKDYPAEGSERTGQEQDEGNQGNQQQADAGPADQDPSEDDPGSGTPKVRRSELHLVMSQPAASIQQAVSVDPSCEDGQAIVGRIGPDSLHVGERNVEFAVEAFVFTATRSGTLTLASTVQKVGDAYELGYGYPLSVHGIGNVDGLPSLDGGLLGVGSDEWDGYDDALEDGEARIRVAVVEGQQYVVVFKQLVGVHPEWSWDYAIGFCGRDASVAGQLWVSPDEDDLVPVEPLEGPISESTPEGAMGALSESVTAEKLQ